MSGPALFLLLLLVGCVNGEAFTGPPTVCSTHQVADTSSATPRADTLEITVCVTYRP